MYIILVTKNEFGTGNQLSYTVGLDGINTFPLGLEQYVSSAVFLIP